MELMEIQGFKQTEIGIIPEDWNLVPFDKIFTFYSTSNYSKAQMSEDGEVGCIHYGLIHAIPNTQYDLKNGIKYYVYSEQAKYELVKDGDVIMVDASEDLEGINKSVEVFGIGNKKYISGLHTYLIRDKDSLLANRFRGIVLNSKLVKNQMLQLAVGMKVFGVSKTQLINVKLPLPPTLEEQKAIATAISDVDELISKLDKLIAKKKDIKKGAMQQLLTPPNKGGKRLPGYSGEWEEKRLGEISDITGAGIDKKINEDEKPVRLLNYMDVMTRNFIYDNELNHKVTAPIGKLISCNVRKGDVFLTPSSELRSDIGVSALAMEDMQGVVYSYHIYRLRYNIDIDPKFGLFALQTKAFLDQPETMCEGSGKRYVVSMSKFRDMRVYIPKTKAEQSSISNIIYDIEQEIEKLESVRSKYKNIKQGMMQELLTGKTRLI